MIDPLPELIRQIRELTADTFDKALQLGELFRRAKLGKKAHRELDLKPQYEHANKLVQIVNSPLMTNPKYRRYMPDGVAAAIQVFLCTPGPNRPDLFHKGIKEKVIHKGARADLIQQWRDRTILHAKMKQQGIPRHQPPGCKIFLGDCKLLAKKLKDKSINVIMCSPPYQERRDGGPTEDDFPQWLVEHMEPFKSKLKDDGSLFVVIRAGVTHGRLQRYVQRMVDAMWEAGWIQPDEKVWVKPDGQPVGHKYFPRRRFEHIFWFAKPDQDLYMDAKAGGDESDRVGHDGSSDLYNDSVRYKSGIARVTDVIDVSDDVIEVSPNKEKNDHGSVYPVGLPLHLIQTYCPQGGTVLDPFSGFGTTAVAALRLKRNFIGFEIDPEYVAASRERILKEQSKLKG